MPRERRPNDSEYYAERTRWVRQGDQFCDVPLSYPFPPDAVELAEGSRRFLSGPFDSGFGMLLSPTCAMAAQGREGEYAHAVGVLAPVLPLELLVELETIKPAAIDDLRVYDHLVNYFYVPSIDDVGLPESLALLYAAITVHHDYLGDRVAQLSRPSTSSASSRCTSPAADSITTSSLTADRATQTVRRAVYAVQPDCSITHGDRQAPRTRAAGRGSRPDPHRTRA